MGVVAHLPNPVEASWAGVVIGVLVAATLVVTFLTVRRYRSGHVRRPMVLMAGPLLLAGVAAAAIVSKDHWDWMLADGSMQTETVSAPKVTVDDDELRFAITNDSVVTYTIGETLYGNRNTAVGATSLVAGEVALDPESPSQSRIGTVVVNVESFTSDSNLRDKKIRHDNLESTEYPYATFEPTDIAGLPDDAAEGTPVEVTITGDLTVKETTRTETFAGTVTWDGDRLTAEVSTELLLSNYDVGPIAISGLVSTDDEVVLTFDLVAERVAADAPEPEPDEFRNPDSAELLAEGQTPEGTDPEPTEPGVTEPAATEAPKATVSFASDIQPIMENHCAGCHTQGGIGFETVALEDAADVAAIGNDIGLVTKTGYMPPWPASDKSVPFQHDWSLSKAQLEDLKTWIEEGRQLDVAPDTGLVPTEQAIREVDADVTLTPEPYVGDEAHKDDYRCQAIEFPEADGPRWIKSFTLEPDAKTVVHHGIFFKAPASSRQAIADMEAADEQPGWQCFGLSNVPDAEQIGGWVPGIQPSTAEYNTGIRVEPGDVLISQIHYHYEHEFPADQSEVLVDFASDDEVAAAGGAFHDIHTGIYLTHAEVPCTPEEQGPLCDRDAVIADVKERFGDLAGIIPDHLIRQCGADLEALMADTDGVGDSECVLDVHSHGKLVGALGHMHEFGKAYRLTLNPDTPDETIILDIPNWSFEWQMNFEPVDPIYLKPGDRIKIECTWDRSLAPMPEPRYITWNEGTDDEMCYTSLNTVAAFADPATDPAVGGTPPPPITE